MFSLHLKLNVFLFIDRDSTQVKTFLNKKRKCLSKRYSSPTIDHLLTLLQNIVDFEVLDNHLIFELSGKYSKMRHPGFMEYLEIIHSKIDEVSDDPSQSEEEVDDIISRIAARNLVPFIYEGWSGRHLHPTDNELRKEIEKCLARKWKKRNRR